ncbi:Pr6Pr family membrane protein [Streptomyces sp. Je 1-369]|uniref:Pr6Pr family membrane protein n=1 Tax=Streptomyces sp. Je 1-369 TaxID=2966192 RepID=UPI0022866FB5|nr:Pr6Pr family membrane protein [Streptomyces sp. Je 1-369]WAL96919.1 Pr6Pr family membrane protein [Streptomyces sp. Je 1-369]
MIAPTSSRDRDRGRHGTGGGVPAEAVIPPVRRPFVAVFRTLIVLAAVTGVVIDLVTGEPLRVLSYFTVQSNVLVAVVLGLAAWRSWEGRPALPPWMTAGTLLFITITGLVYHFVLANDTSGFSMTEGAAALSSWHSTSNQLLHTVTPIGVALDWFLLTRPGGLRPRHAGLWLLYPLAYLAFALVRGALMSPGPMSRYPYPFLDVDLHGYPGVLGNAVIFGLAFYALALLIIGLDRIRPVPRGPGSAPPKTGFRLRPPVR